MILPDIADLSKAESLNRWAEQGYVFDHEYWGNACSGFGGTLECQHIDPHTRQRCGRGPYVHHPIWTRHSRGWIAVDITQTPEGYVGRHRLTVSSGDLPVAEDLPAKG